MDKNVRITNRKASFEYNFIEKFEAGVMLLGSEVKSIREGNSSIGEAYCYFKDNELFIRNMYVAEYKHNVGVTHDVLREKKLLLNRKELNKLKKGLEVKGQTIVPLVLYTNKKGLLKLEIALSSGKKTFNKRQSIKSRDIDRDTKREIKNN
jgi:SsrA-binding protein